MALNFSGESIVPKRGVNLTGRKTTGVRTSILKKGQKVITLGGDVLEALKLGDLGDGLKVKVVKGSGAVWGGKLMVQPATDGALTLRYVNKEKKTAAHIMSASLPFEHAAKAKYKVYEDDKALVIVIPETDDETGKADKQADAPTETAAEGGEGGDAPAGEGAAAAGDADFAA